MKTGVLIMRERQRDREMGYLQISIKDDAFFTVSSCHSSSLFRERKRKEKERLWYLCSVLMKRREEGRR